MALPAAVPGSRHWQKNWFTLSVMYDQVVEPPLSHFFDGDKKLLLNVLVVMDVLVVVVASVLLRQIFTFLLMLLLLLVELLLKLLPLEILLFIA